MPILRVENIKKRFGRTQVLNDISFDLEKGEVMSIIGSSGSGKTTLLRCLNFLETPDSGRISVNDKLIWDRQSSLSQRDDEIRRNRLHFGLVFQNFNLFPQYTAFENVTLASKLLAQEREDFKHNKTAIFKEIDDYAHDLLAQVGLSDKENNYPHQLSGGQQQRVAIARALSLSPDILCFDEPTSALDPELTGEVLKVIQRLAERNMTMIIVTHEMEFAHDVSDRIIFLDSGKIIENGTPDDVFLHSTNERTKHFLEKYYNR